MKKYLGHLSKAFGEVFAHTSYIVLASVLAVVAFLFAVLLPNFPLIGEVYSASGASFATTFRIAATLVGGIGTNFSVLSAGYTIAIAILFGVNVAMVVYLLKRTRAGLGNQGAAAGLGGIASGALGIGCAACGSFILSAMLSSLGAASALAVLPLRGGEFGIVSVILLLGSLFVVSKRIVGPNTCAITQL